MKSVLNLNNTCHQYLHFANQFDYNAFSFCLFILYTFLSRQADLSINRDLKLWAFVAMPPISRFHSPTPTRRRERSVEERGRSRTRTRTFANRQEDPNHTRAYDIDDDYHRSPSMQLRTSHRNQNNYLQQDEQHHDRTQDKNRVDQYKSPSRTRRTSNRNQDTKYRHRDSQHHRDHHDNKHHDFTSPHTLQAHYSDTLNHTNTRSDRRKTRDTELPLLSYSSRLHSTTKPDRKRSRTPPRSDRHKERYSQYHADTSPSPGRTPEGLPLTSTPAAPAPPYVRSFRHDKHHYDTNEIAHLNFPKHIKTTDHSIANGPAKRDPHDIYLWELLYNKNENWALRYLAHGRYTAVEVTKSFKGSVFVQELLRNIRGYKFPNGQDGPQPIDLDQIATDYARNHDMPFKTGIEKKAIYTIIAKQT